MELNNFYCKDKYEDQEYERLMSSLFTLLSGTPFQRLYVRWELKALYLLVEESMRKKEKTFFQLLKERECDKFGITGSGQRVFMNALVDLLLFLFPTNSWTIFGSSKEDDELISQRFLFILSILDLCVGTTFVERWIYRVECAQIIYEQKCGPERSFQVLLLFRETRLLRSGVQEYPIFFSEFIRGKRRFISKLRLLVGTLEHSEEKSQQTII